MKPTDAATQTRSDDPLGDAHLGDTPHGDAPDRDAHLASDPLGDEIAALCAHISAATFRLLTLLQVFDVEERWRGHRSCAHWLSWRTGISLGPAREKVRVARCLPALPRISAAFAKGKISYSKVRALTRVATADNEDELLTFADHGTTAHVERLVREWRRLDRGDAGQAARDARRCLSLHLADDGSYEIRGQLVPEVGALLAKALEAAEEKLYREQRSDGPRQPRAALPPAPPRGARGGLAGRDGRERGPAVLQSPGGAHARSPAAPGHRGPAARSGVTGAIGGRSGTCPPGLRAGPLAWTARHRPLGRRRAVAGGTHRLGMGSGMPLEGRG